MNDQPRCQDIDAFRRDTILLRFEEVASRLEKEGKAFGKQSTIKNGDQPDDSTPDSLALRYSAGSYATCAKAIRDEIKATRKWLNTLAP